MEERIKKDILNLKKLVPNIDAKDGVILLDINGPKDSYYENGIWKIHISIPDDYPFKSPSVGFLDKIYHPNIDLQSGTICLNTLNETWSPIYNLLHICNIFIPQLLLYPNPSDPLNEEAAKLYLDHSPLYKQNIRKYTKIFSL